MSTYFDAIQFCRSFTTLHTSLLVTLYLSIFSSSLIDGTHLSALTRALLVHWLPTVAGPVGERIRRQRLKCLPNHFDLFSVLGALVLFGTVTLARLASSEWGTGGSAAAWFVLPLTPTTVVSVPLSTMQIVSLWATECFIWGTLVMWLLVREAPASIVRYEGLALLDSYEHSVLEMGEGAEDARLEEGRSYFAL